MARKEWSGHFADAANHHGFKHARWRRLWRVQIQDWLIAGIQNIKILLKYRLRPATAAAAALIVVLSHRLGCFIERLFLRDPRPSLQPLPTL